MSDSCKRPLDNNDDLPPTASDAGSNTKKARRSSDPAATEDENQEPHSPNQDVIDKGKQKATSEPRTINPQDPFDLFDAGIVRMIIAELDAPDTETLRRVSKLWKASSEFHCGRTMLRQHFPEAAANLSEDEPGSCEEENLRFRRYLYRQQSFQHGYATRAFKFTRASTWDLKNDTILWSNSHGMVFFLNMRANGVAVQISIQVTEERIDLRPLPIPFCCVDQVSLVKGGDLIVRSFVRDDKRRKRHVRGQHIRNGVRSNARINMAGQVLWEITSCPRTWSMPAIGSKEIFFIMEGPAYYNIATCCTSEPKLIKYSLQDGSVVPGFEPVRQEAGCKEMNLLPDALFLTNQEKFAVWTDIDDIVSIISTSNRDCLYQFHKDATAVVSKSVIDESLWVIDYRLEDAAPNALEFDWVTDHTHMAECSFFLPWKETTTGFHIKPIEFPSMLQSYWTKWRFDADSAALLRMTIASSPGLPSNWRPQRLGPEGAEEEVSIPVPDVTGPFGKVLLAATHKLPADTPGHLQFETKNPPATVSLPTSAGKRIPLDVDIRFQWRDCTWVEKDEGYFRMAENYLLFHFSDEQVLLLMDFWPSW